MTSWQWAGIIATLITGAIVLASLIARWQRHAMRSGMKHREDILLGPPQEFVEAVLRTAIQIQRAEREVRQVVRSQPRGVPFWAHNPATSKRPRR